MKDFQNAHHQYLKTLVVRHDQLILEIMRLDFDGSSAQELERKRALEIELKILREDPDMELAMHNQHR